MKYTKIPSDLFQKIGKNAGIIVDSFNPTTRVAGNILIATTGGIKFSDTPSMIDFGEDIDNCPKGSMELNVLDSREIHLSGTGVSISPTIAKMLSIATNSNGHIVPTVDISLADYEDIWFITDYGDVNTGDTAGFIAIHLMNTLSTSGFQMQTTDKGKANFAFDFRAYYSLETQEVAPYEIYIEEGSGGTSVPSVTLSKHYLTLAEGAKSNLAAVTTPASASVTWSSSADSKASVSSGEVTGNEAGSAIITATITVDSVPYNDTCTVVVTA